MATTMTTFVPPNRPSDGRRNGANGWWISEAEAKELTVGNEEWWKMEGIAGRTVARKQYDPKGTKERPIWIRGGMELCISVIGRILSYLIGILFSIGLELTTTTVQRRRVGSTLANAETDHVTALASSFGSNQHHVARTTNMLAHLL